MRKRFKYILRIIFILIILTIIVLVLMQFKGKNESIPKYKEIDVIKGYNYELEDRDTKIMQDIFKKLKKELNKDSVDYNLYAEYLSELFIIDLFTMNNKDNKYDVGSSEYVLDDARENYQINVEDTIYKYLVEKSNRKEEYPIVKSITKEALENTEYKFNNETYEAYKVTLNWEYEKDNNYDKKGIVTLIKKDNKLFVVTYEGVKE